MTKRNGFAGAEGRRHREALNEANRAFVRPLAPPGGADPAYILVVLSVLVIIAVAIVYR